MANARRRSRTFTPLRVVATTLISLSSFAAACGDDDPTTSPPDASANDAAPGADGARSGSDAASETNTSSPATDGSIPTGDAAIGDGSSVQDADEQDASTNDANDAGVPTDAATHVIFVTNGTYTGDLIGAANAIALDAGVAGGGFDAGDWRGAADSICQTSAQKANVPGTFWALLRGPGGPDIFTRLQDSDGPWALVDGAPVAPNVAALEDGHILVSIDKTETGAQRPPEDGPPSHVWFGRSDFSCDGWSTSIHVDEVNVGSSTRLTSYWWSTHSKPCSSVHPLFCAQVGAGGGPLRPVTKPPGAKIAFVTSQTYFGDFALGALGPDPVHTAADAICQAEAQGKLTGTFRAWASSSTASALDYFTTRAMNGPWHRPDGILVASSRSALVAPSNLANAIAINASGALASTLVTIAGTWAEGTLSDNCAGFVSNAATEYTRSGQSWAKHGDGWAARQTQTCDQPGALYCFEE